MNVLYPIFVLALLTLAVAMRLGFLRWRAVSRREVKVEYYQAYQGEGEPPAVRIVSRHLINLMEMPVLFYIACLIAYVTGLTGGVILGLAWTYAALRIVHTVIHLGSNVVLWRFRVFAFSVMVLTLLWVVLLAGLVTR
ncbi:MAPEG family protein [Elongatibacter sediminis]|uniref:MAPEG family protein n=1 Tax=Elongatibacter sediminis TaxID=3119006 RepID=A0AAW9R7W8_9GAMM